MNAFLRHAKFQVPFVTARDAVSSVWRRMWAAAGSYEPLSSDELAWREAGPVPFKGDIPVGAEAVHSQNRLEFVQDRPLIERVENLVVTPLGAGWTNGVLHEKYSACRPGLRMLTGARRPYREVPKGFFIQSEHIDTFGDWMSEYLSPLSRLPNIDAPVFLPLAMMRKSYVRRDAERTGVDFQAIDQPVLIKDAFVVRQGRCIRYWREQDANALRQFMNVSSPLPEPGSLLYLSRHGERSEVADRTHPNLIVEDVVKERGGRVLRTGESSLEDYLDAARYAETILYDHGSAAYNMVYWRPRRAVEFVSDAWWMNSFLFFADSIGVKDYTIICTDRGGDSDIRKRLETALDAALPQ